MSAASVVPYNEKIKLALVKFKDGLSTRMDSWINPVTGYGTAQDKSEFGYILPSRVLTDIETSALYHSDDMAARMVDVVPQEMLREGFSIETGIPELDLPINAKLDELDSPGKYADGIRWGRCYGGSALLVGADDGRESSLPLVPERAKDVAYLYAIDRRMLWPLSWYDEPGHPKLGQPKTYLVTTVGGTHFNTTSVHESRLIIFRGAHTGIRERMQLMGWDLSVLQRIYEVLRSFNTGWKSVEALLTDGNQAIFKMTGLADSLSSGSEQLLRARMQAMDLYRSVMRAMVIDADGKEEFARQSTTFAGIPDTLDKFMLRLAAAVQIPVTILMGQSPAGMNATGDSDFRWFYDRIRAEQTTILAPKIRRLVDIYLRTKAGQSLLSSKKYKEIGVKFPALWTETPLVAAQRRYSLAQADALYITSQAILPDEVALQRFRPDGFQNELVLTPAGVKAREDALKSDLEKLGASSADDEALADETATSEAAVTETASLLKLTASDLASIVKVNEARASVGLPPLPAPDGQMTLPQFKAKYASLLATVANAEAGVDTGGDNPTEKPKPAGPPGFGGGSFGGAKPADGADGGDNPFPPKKPDEGKPTPPEDKLPSDKELTAEERSRMDGPYRAAGERPTYDAGPRPFVLQRDEDESGVSGTGEIAAGCTFADGKVAVRWKTATASTTLFDSVSDMLKVHGHNGKTRIIYDDERRDGGEWDEDAHPRAENGQFGEGGGGGEAKSGGSGRESKTGGSEKLPPAGPSKDGPPAPAAPISHNRTWVEHQLVGKEDETYKEHFDKHPDDGGKPTAERAATVHDPIIKAAFEGRKTVDELNKERAARGQPPEKKVAILTMGGPASGKGTVLEKLEKGGLDKSHFVHVDPDDVKLQMPEYKASVPSEKDMKAGSTAPTFRGAANQTHEESSYIAKQITAQAVAGGHHVIIDGTGGNADKFIKQIEDLKSNGYDVHVHYAALDPNTGVQRAMAREEQTGRHVPEKVLRNTYAKIATAQPRVLAAAPNLRIYNAANGHSVAYEKSGGDVKVHEPAFHAALIAKR